MTTLKKSRVAYHRCQLGSKYAFAEGNDKKEKYLYRTNFELAEVI